MILLLLLDKLSQAHLLLIHLHHNRVVIMLVQHLVQLKGVLSMSLQLLIKLQGSIRILAFHALLDILLLYVIQSDVGISTLFLRLNPILSFLELAVLVVL